MQFKIKRFLLWFLLYYFLIAGALRDYLISGTTDSFDITSSIFVLTSLAIFFLYSLIPYYVLFKFYPNQKWVYCGIGLLAALFVPMGMRFLIEQILTEALFQSTNYPSHYGTKNYIIDNYFFAIRFITFGTIYYFVTYSLYKQRRESNLLASKQEMEMALLKSQINPHFLLNSLNNIYSLVYHKSDKALSAMDKLTDILKYTLYESKEVEVLEKAMNIARKYLELARLRVAHPIYYNLESDVHDSSLLVPQHLVIPIVENAIKHGELGDPEEPARTILTKIGNQLIVNSVNKIRQVQKDKGGGIGLANLERRLQLLYDTRYTMKTGMENGVFILEIKIPID